MITVITPLESKYSLLVKSSTAALIDLCTPSMLTTAMLLQAKTTRILYSANPLESLEPIRAFGRETLRLNQTVSVYSRLIKSKRGSMLNLTELFKVKSMLPSCEKRDQGKAAGSGDCNIVLITLEKIAAVTHAKVGPIKF